MRRALRLIQRRQPPQLSRTARIFRPEGPLNIPAYRWMFNTVLWRYGKSAESAQTPAISAVQRAVVRCRSFWRDGAADVERDVIPSHVALDSLVRRRLFMIRR